MLEFVRDVRDADSGSDHFLLITKMWLRFKRLKQAEKQMIFVTAKLKDINIRIRYQLEVRNRFASLEKTDDIEVRWSNFKEWMERIMDINGFGHIYWRSPLEKFTFCTVPKLCREKEIIFCSNFVWTDLTKLKYW